MAKKGRPGKLSAVLIARICERVRYGCSPNQAARLEGVGASTFLEWRQRAQAEPGSIYARLFEELEQTELDVVEKAARVMVDLLEAEDPKIRLQAARFYLERRHPEVWARRTEARLVGADGGAVQVAAQVAGPDGGAVRVEVAPRVPWTDAELKAMAPEQLEQAVRLAVRLSESGQVRIDALFSRAQFAQLSPAQLLAVSTAAAGAQA